MGQERIKIQGKAVPIRGNDVDTDRIVPARFLKEITFDNMGDYLFADARFDSDGNALDHPLNDSKYDGATIMVVQNNFGCGSSREHAPQAILRYGIQAIIGESFAEIFAGNCKALGIPTVLAPADQIETIISQIESGELSEITLDLDSKVCHTNGSEWPISLPEERRQVFLKGTWDELTLLNDQAAQIAETANRLPYVNGFQG